MLNLLKCVIILFLELNIYLCFGYIMGKIKFIPEARTFILKGIYGFIGYHVLFWCIAFPCTLLDGFLTSLIFLWEIPLASILLFIFILHFKKLVKLYRNAIIAAWNNLLFLLPCLVFGILLTYYLCVNGDIDIDSRTYIGEVTSMIDTDRLAGISVTSGMEIQFIQLRRSFSMFGANSAVLCKLFQVHPLVFCRTTRAAINAIFFTGTVFELFRWFFRYHKSAISHAFMCTTLAQGFIFAFANTIYTESRFMLYRAYEGKAYCSSTLILITILITLTLCDSNDIRFFILLFFDMLAGMSISASSTFILPLAGGSIILAYAFYQKKWSYIPTLLLTILPNLVYIILSISGFAGFSLEG